MLKHFIIRNLHSLFGFEKYLFIFTIFKISTLRFDKRKREYLFFTTLFQKNSNVIVIGANTGITTIPIAKKVFEGKVFAIEPILINFSVLKKIIKHYKQTNVNSFNFALGNENKEIEMIMPVLNKTRSHGLCYINEDGIGRYESGIKFQVHMKKLDDIFSFKENINGIKIVAENYERFIFEGGRELIAKNRPIIYCELWFNESREKVLSLIKSWNYDINVLEKKKLISYNPDKHRTKNLFFIPRFN